jgi:hypothetical protein
MQSMSAIEAEKDPAALKAKLAAQVGQFPLSRLSVGGFVSLLKELSF